MLIHQTLPYIIFRLSKDNSDQVALKFRNEENQWTEWTYKEFLDYVSFLSLSLLDLGISRGDRLCIFLDNCKEWATMDIAAMSLGIVTISQGSDILVEDMKKLVSHLQPRAFFIRGKKEYEKLKETEILEKQIIISVDRFDFEKEDTSFNIYFLEDLLLAGKNLPGDKEEFLLTEIQKGNPSDIFTISSTSGTMGAPKGACLTYKTITFQLEATLRRVRVKYRKEVLLSILPIWHAYERILFYLGLYIGGTIVYSKPIPQYFLEDIKEINPSILPGVPRLFEMVYDKVQKQVSQKNWIIRWLYSFFYEGTNIYYDLLYFREKRSFTMVKIPTFIKLFLDIFASLFVFFAWPIQAIGYWLFFRKIARVFGKNIRIIVSGGAHLPLQVDKFFRNIGLHIVEGYGMTEMGPLITFRDFPGEKIGSVGRILDDVEYYLKDSSGKKTTRRGELFIKSPQMMVGYYNNKEATQEIIMEDGFLRTGDIVEVDHEGSLRIVGRVKNIIVLANGENIEVEPLEEELQISPYITYSMIVGQDEKFLGALIVPDFALLESYAREEGVIWKDRRDLCKSEKIRELYRSFIKEKINHHKNYSRTPIVNFVLLPKEFVLYKELTATLKVKRLVVERIYSKEIESLYSKK